LTLPDRSGILLAHLSAYIYYHARVCTDDHKQFANLPKYAAKVLVELRADKMKQVIPLIVKLAAQCLDRHFKLNSLLLRATETDQIVPFYFVGERRHNCDYEDESGRAWIIEDLSDKHSQSRKPVKQPLEESL
jgi:hypothetical protein